VNWSETGAWAVQIARELTISVSNRRLGLFPTRWQETLEAQKRPDEVDLIPNYVGGPYPSSLLLLSSSIPPCFVQTVVGVLGHGCSMQSHRPPTNEKTKSFQILLQNV